MRRRCGRSCSGAFVFFWAAANGGLKSQHSGSEQATLLQVDECLVGLLQGIHANLGFERDFCRQLQEFASVAPGTVRNASYNTLLIQERVIHLRDRTHGDSRKRKCPGFSERSQRLWNQRSRGSEDNRGIEQMWWSALGSAHPRGPQP